MAIKFVSQLELYNKSLIFAILTFEKYLKFPKQKMRPYLTFGPIFLYYCYIVFIDFGPIHQCIKQPFFKPVSLFLLAFRSFM